LSTNRPLAIAEALGNPAFLFGAVIDGEYRKGYIWPIRGYLVAAGSRQTATQ